MCGVLIQDVESGSVLYSNSPAQETLAAGLASYVATPSSDGHHSNGHDGNGKNASGSEHASVSTMRPGLCYTADEPHRWVHVEAASIRNAGRELTVYTLADITDHLDQLWTLEWQVRHDVLTGLPNRRMFFESARMLLTEAGLVVAPMAFLVIDLDHFKDVNDTFGHPSGDVVLQQASQRLRMVLNQRDVLARIGGDEFGVIMPAVGGPTEAFRMADTMVKALEEPFDIASCDVGISASIGLAMAPGQGNDVDTLIRKADMAMYSAKREGSGSALFSHHQDRASNIGTTPANLRRAIEHEELVMHYQPEVHFRPQPMAYAEALIRWEHPAFGLIGPDTFIGLAERSRLIHPMTRWILNAALQQCYAWRLEGIELGVAVNLSEQNLQDAQLPGLIYRLLQTWGVPAHYLKLEITESRVMSDAESAIAGLARLAEMGMKISIDDFGTGYSSLAQVVRLPVNELKLDKSFTMNMMGEQSKRYQVIVRATIGMAHDLGLTVVAEGVENRASWRFLEAAHCDVAQGYLVTKAMPGNQVVQWINGSKWKHKLKSAYAANN
ncbi:MAG: putative bifunctional diguanylate cyclase/phosphodiesterase [Chloroflexota bacterium]